MAKYLKQYNKDTGKWEVVSKQDTTIYKTLSDGTKIKDNDIVITNAKFNSENDDKTLKTTLDDISDDISKLKRNVSWLAEHKESSGGKYNYISDVQQDGETITFIYSNGEKEDVFVGSSGITNIDQTDEGIVFYFSDGSSKTVEVGKGNIENAIVDVDQTDDEIIFIYSDGSEKRIIASAGGGGGGRNYGISLKSPILDNGSYYSKEPTLTVKFAITGGTLSEIFQWRYVWDGLEVSAYATAKTDQVITVVIDNLNSVTTATTHSFSIEALNPQGLSFEGVNFNVYETTLKVELDTERNEISNNEVLLAMNSVSGNITLKIKNGVQGSQNTIIYECNQVVEQSSFLNKTTSEQTVNISLWKLINRNAVTANDLYEIKIQLQAILGTTLNNTTDPLYIKVRINNPDSLAIYFNGIDYEYRNANDEDIENEDVIKYIGNDLDGYKVATQEELEDDAIRKYVYNTEGALPVENSDRLSFTFKVFLPLKVTNKTIYYKVTLISPDGNNYVIVGDESNTYNKQKVGSANLDITVQNALNSYEISDGWVVSVRVWIYNGSLYTIRNGIFDILKSNSDIFSRQSAKRDSMVGSATGDTCLVAFDASSNMSTGVWISNIKNYVTTNGEEIQTTAVMTPYGGNGSNIGCIPDAVVPHIRLQNEAYAIADLSEYEDEIKYLTNQTANNYNGFNISFTFESDIHPTADRGVFLFGQNNSDGTLMNGCRITLELAEWYIHTESGKNITLKTYLRQGKKNTIDFSYDGKTACIYVNGIVNATSPIEGLDTSETFQFPTKAYIGGKYINNEFVDMSDINVYEFAIYTYKLTPLQITVNSKNARLEGRSSDESVISEYRNWKRRNLIYTEDYDPETPLCYLIKDDGEYGLTDVNKLQTNSPIPVVYIDCNGSTFTSTVFHTTYTDKTITGTTFPCKIKYIDPTKNANVEFTALISLQGTSTLGYYIKNLEIIVDERCTHDSEMPKLFQPKDDWFPEREFTLKADVVDSAHANNATIGRWINQEAKVMVNNPAMDAMTDEYRPKEKIVYNGKATTFTHTDTRTIGGKEIDFDEKVTLKHNLEGFPVIVIIRFADKTEPELIGMYSFNLGRYSFFNMGMSFLKCFSRRNVDNPNLEISCPALVDYYEEYGRQERFGGTNGVLPSDIYSYEFGADADDNTEEHMTWSQDHKSVLQLYGSFNFNGSDGSNKVSSTSTIWDRLSELFKITACINVNTAQHRTKEKYRVPEGGKKLTLYSTSKYEVSTDPSELRHNLSIDNACGYFVIATAFGMVDSLGKNMTIRTWDGGKKWWHCFYDMDTALGLNNEGAESISSMAYIDTYENTLQGGVSQVKVNKHQLSGGYNAYNSKLYAILRDDNFLYSMNRKSGDLTHQYYDEIWTRLRIKGGALESALKFVDLMESQIGSCGEMMYNYDYYMKYIFDSQNAAMLHGMRIEYVRNWLTKRLYFLDGVFEDSGFKTSGNFVDSPLNLNNFVVSNYGTENGITTYKFTVSSPTFMKINTGNSPNPATIFLPEGNETEITAIASTGKKQTNFTSSNLITSFKGISGIKPANFNTNNTADYATLNSVTEFDIAGSSLLEDDPIDFAKIFKYNGKSSLETINLSNTKFLNATTYNVHLDGFTKIKFLDISNSDVTNLILPQSNLKTLRVANSNIDGFTMSGQTKLQTVNFSGCTKIQTIRITNCEGLTGLTINSLPILSSIVIENCKNIKQITITNNIALNNITLSNNESLEDIRIGECSNERLNIDIVGSPLKIISINDVMSENTIRLPEREYLSGVTKFNLSNDPYVDGFRFGNEDVEKYNGYNVYDISPMVNLEGENFTIAGMQNVRYLRVPNIEDKPFNLLTNSVTDCYLIIKIFGHINIAKTGVFSGLGNFYLNYRNEAVKDLVSTDFVTTEQDKYWTNLTISTDSLKNCFGGTNCGLGDVYYILQKCDNVTSLEGTFESCRGIICNIDNPLNERLFEHCGNVTTIKNLFAGCPNMGGLLSSNLLDPIADNIDNLDNTFEGGSYYIVSPNNDKNINTFFNKCSHIKSIIGFNPKPYIDDVGYGYSDNSFFLDHELLRDLTELEVLENSFSACKIRFSRIANKELFENNHFIRRIKSSFVNVMMYNKPEESISSKIFSGCTNLESIESSFSFVAENYPLTIKYGNSFFKDCCETIRIVDSVFRGDIVKVIDYDDCNEGENFPYDIFKGCVNLESASYFFEKLSGKTDEVVSLPGRIFEDCESLVDFSYGFSTLMFKYRLTPNSFINCHKLSNLCGVFNEDAGVDKKFGKIGMIPFRLFYTGVSKTILDLSNSFAGTHTDLVESYTWDGNEEEGYLYEHKDSYVYTKEGVDYFAYEFDDIPYSYIDSNDETIYTNNNNVVTDSEGVEHTPEILPNVKYEYSWNIYIYDGTVGFDEKVKKTNIYKKALSGEIDIPTILPDIFVNNTNIQNYNALGEPETGVILEHDQFLIFAAQNYFCPPDIFKYCSDTDETKVDRIFYNSGDSEGIKFSGVRGRIPEILFYPLTKLKSTAFVFGNTTSLLPYTWGYFENGEMNYGITYPPKLFYKFKNLVSIDGMFRKHNIWGSTIIDRSMLSYCGGGIYSAASLFASAQWFGNTGPNYQLPTTFFNSCTLLNNVSSMFTSSNIRISSSHFTVAYNKYISNCSAFMQGSESEGDSLPQFWNFPLMKNYSGCYSGLYSEELRAMVTDKRYL